MPGGTSEWSGAGVTTNLSNIAKTSDPVVLNNIINDPAQPAAVKQAAQTRLDELNTVTTQQAPAPAAPAGLLNQDRL